MRVEPDKQYTKAPEKVGNWTHVIGGFYQHTLGAYRHLCEDMVDVNAEDLLILETQYATNSIPCPRCGARLFIKD